MDRLEQLCKENRDQLDHAEPAAGHFDRFRRKLEDQPSGKRGWLTYLKAASITLLVILSTLWMYENLINRSSLQEGISLGEISPEYQQAEIYYTNMVQSKYREIDEMTFPEDSLQKEILKKELSDMDLIYENLRKELEDNPSNERLIHAMIEHYELKLDVMNQILNQLNELKKLELNNNTNHEKTNI
jgi:hypothetical protein